MQASRGGLIPGENGHSVFSGALYRPAEAGRNNPGLTLD
jgi:hypothetical protein